MNSMIIILKQVLAPVYHVLLSIAPQLLNLLGALILLIIGLLIAKGLQWIVVSIFVAGQLDKGCKKIGFTDLLTNGGIKSGVTELLGALVYWLTIFVTVTAVLNSLGLVIANVMLAKLLAYLPSVIGAAYVLGIGIFVAAFVASIVMVIANNIGLSNTAALAKITQYAVVIFAFLAAIGQLGIDPNWIITSIQIVIGAIGLAFAIAFGLGAKDKATDLLDKMFG